jgi:excisionase family DNA binding protein
VPKVVNATVSLDQAAKRLGVHYMTVYRYVRLGQLPAERRDGTWHVLVSDLDHFVGAKKKRAKRGSRPAADWPARLEQRLLDGDEAGAAKLLDDALASGHDLFSLYLEVVSPSMVSIGERWAAGKLHIHEEHRASVIVGRLMARVSARFAHRGPSRGTVVIGGPSGEHHGLSLTMVADLLRSKGWNVSDIGTNVPAESFATAVKGVDQLRAVCVGVTLSQSLPAARDVIREVRKVLPDGVAVYLGGAGVDSDDTAKQLGADVWARDPRSLIALLSA